jgi:hypothetical protein
MVLCANEVPGIRSLLFEMMNDTATFDKGPLSKSETTGQGTVPYHYKTSLGSS